MTPTRSTEADKNYTTAGAGCDLSPARVDNTTVEAAPPIVVSMGGRHRPQPDFGSTLGT
ncbi:MAG TPA: hypothetical protein VGG14_11575 [Candidatus Sulfotelmatobacter sp.]|jgi:hypothetical protein